MKKLLGFILAVVLVSPTYALSDTASSGVLGCEEEVGTASCSGEYGNIVTTDASYTGTTADRLYLFKVTIDCDGSSPDISTRIRHFSSDGAEAVFVIYSDSGGAPDERLWYSSPWYDAANGTLTTVVTSTNVSLSAGDYWVGLSVEGGSRIYSSNGSSGDAWIVSAGDNFPTPPADLSGAGESLSSSLEIGLLW